VLPQSLSDQLITSPIDTQMSTCLLDGLHCGLRVPVLGLLPAAAETRQSQLDRLCACSTFETSCRLTRSGANALVPQASRRCPDISLGPHAWNLHFHMYVLEGRARASTRQHAVCRGTRDTAWRCTSAPRILPDSSLFWRQSAKLVVVMCWPWCCPR
jgi:hypothetical protein